LLFVGAQAAAPDRPRLHLDLVPTDRPREDELVRLLRLGATLVRDHRNLDGTGWVVLADPEGNQFCLERSELERRPELMALGRAQAALVELVDTITDA